MDCMSEVKCNEQDSNSAQDIQNSHCNLPFLPGHSHPNFFGLIGWRASIPTDATASGGIEQNAQP
jgi:hypothetical protein